MKKTREILIICFITLVLLEGILQLFYYVSNGSLLFYRVHTKIYAKDADYVFKVKPNLKYRHKTNEFNVIYYTNNKGLRCSSKMEEYDKISNKFNIILNGPSFAFGWGVDYEQCFANVLQRKLNNGGIYGKKDFQIISFGVPNRIFKNQIRYFKHNESQYKPKILLQLIYGSMMFRELDPFEEVEVKEGYLVDKNATTFASMITKLKESGIIFYSWIAYNRIKTIMGGRNYGDKIIGAGRDINQYNVFDLNDINIKKSLKYYFDLKSYCDSINTKLIIIFYPLSYVVHNEDVSRWKHLGVRDIEKDKLFNKTYCDYLNDHGVTCLNMTDSLINEAKTSHKRLYYWLDIHWTPYGNEVIAQAVAKYLLSHKAQYFNN